jgi:hypothetical protein
MGHEKNTLLVREGKGHRELLFCRRAVALWDRSLRVQEDARFRVVEELGCGIEVVPCSA